MATGVKFPAFLKMEYQPGGSAKTAFLAEIGTMTDQAKRSFKASFDEIDRYILGAAASAKSARSAFTFDLPGLRKAAADADYAHQRLILMRDTAASLARSTGDTSRETQLYVAALRAQAIEADQAKRSADAQIKTYARLQGEIDRTAASHGRLAEAHRATFLEQARSEASAFRSQRNVEELSAPALNRRAIDNGAGFGALAAAADYADRAEAMRRALDPAHAAQARFNVEIAEARTLIAAGALSLDEYCSKLRQERQLLDQSSAAGRQHAQTSGQQRIGMQQLSMQIGDMATMYALGANASQIFASQAGQVVQAVSLMGNGTSKFATFMMGPWGAALTAGTLVLTPFIARLFDSEKALKSAALASDGLSGAQGAMGSMFDLVTGKIKNQNDMLRLNIQLTAMNLRAEAIGAKSRADAATIAAGRPSLLNSVGEMLAQGAGAAPIRTTRAPKTVARAMLEGVSSGRVQGSDAMTWAQKADFSGSGISQKEFISAITSAVEARAKTQTADLIEKSLKDRALAPEFRQPGPKNSKGGSGADEAKRLATFAESASERVARINARFDEQPKLIDQAAQATRELDAIIKDLGERKPAGFSDLIADAEEAKTVVQDALVKPFRDLEEQSKRRVQLQALISSGYEADASALQAIWQIEDRLGSESELRARTAELIAQGREAEAAALSRLVEQYPSLKREALDRARAEEDAALSIRRQQESLNSYRDASRSIREDLAGIFEGQAPDFGAIFKRLNAEVLTEQLFGSMFQDLDRWVQRNTGLGRVTTEFTDRTAEAGSALVGLTSDIAEARANLTSSGSFIDGPAIAAAPQAGFIPGSSVALGAVDRALDDIRAANDNTPFDPNAEIVVTAKRALDVKAPANTVMAMTPELFARQVGLRVGDVLTSQLSGLLGTGLAGAIGRIGGGALSGSMIGGTPGAILGGVQGLAGSLGLRGAPYKAMGDALGGMGEGMMVASIGNALGLEMSNTGAAIGGALLGPVGGLAGGLIGKLFSSPKWATSVASGGGASTRGNKGDWEGATGGAAGGVNEAIARMAEQFGAEIGDYAVSLGLNNGNWHVSTTGRSGRLRGNQGWSDVTDFKKDDAAALTYAIRDAISDGALQGLRAGTRVLLQKSGDLDEQIRKALDFESIFTRLREYKDPVGAAMDGLDKEFSRLRDIAITAGEGMVELEELYGIEREKVLKEASERVLGSLKALYDTLTVGDSGLSLRDREANARATYEPLTERVAAGDRSAFDDYGAAAETLLDLSRQIYGSQEGYFAIFDEIRTLTKDTIGRETDLVALAADRDSPFQTSAVPANDNAAVVSAIDQLGTRLLDGLGGHLDALNRNVGTLIEQGLANGTTGIPLFQFPTSF